MKKEFIPKDLAFELKSIGYDEPCVATDYDLNGDIMIEHIDQAITNTELSQITREINEENIMNDEEYIEDSATIPTFSQAFRWFRENNMHSYIDFADGKWSFIIFDTKLPVYYYPIQDQDTDTNDNVEYDTYEDAEIACLKKLIEIIKK